MTDSLLSKQRFMVGIDPGVQTGMAIWRPDMKRLAEVESLQIHEAMDRIRALKPWLVLVVVEDARMRTWFGTTGREKLQGAGSVKRDCVIWQDFLASLEIKAEFVRPAANKTKLDSKTFERLTGWTKRTNEHARDAAMLVVGRKG